MRKLVALQLALLFSALYLAACSNSDSIDISREDSGDSAGRNDSLPSDGEYLVDSRDGQRYRIVTIGDYTWMAENLNYETDSSTCFDDPDFCEKFGRSYSSEDARNPSICPVGWHVPDTNDIDRLISFVDWNRACKVLRSTDGWDGESGTDEFGFSFLPSGLGQLWSREGYYMDFSVDDEKVMLYRGRGHGHIRCQKDYPPIEKTAVPCKTETEDNCEYGTLTDARDGQVYKTVKIGNQWWMAENLNYGANFRNCCDGEECFKHGNPYMYHVWRNSNVDIGADSACPAGWRLPKRSDMDTLFAAVGGDSVAGLVLGSRNAFRSGKKAGTDAYGFSAIYMLQRLSDMERDDTPWWMENSYTRRFWVDRGSLDYSGCYFDLNDSSVTMSCFIDAVTPYASVRCIRDASVDDGMEEGYSTLEVSSSEIPCEGTFVMGNYRCRNKDEDNCEYDSLTDARDGQVYKTVKVGSQWWMAENLRLNSDGSMCFNNQSEECESRGRFYLWSAAMDSAGLYSDDGKGCGYGTECSPTKQVRGVCPDGWHIPSRSEWAVLDSITHDLRAWKYMDALHWDRYGETPENLKWDEWDTDFLLAQGTMLMSEDEGENSFGLGMRAVGYGEWNGKKMDWHGDYISFWTYSDEKSKDPRFSENIPQIVDVGIDGERKPELLFQKKLLSSAIPVRCVKD